MLDSPTPAAENSVRFGSGDQVCMICQERILKNQQIVQLDCLHIYHIHCAKRWLVDNRNNCPVCRAAVIATNRKEESELKRQESLSIVTGVSQLKRRKAPTPQIV
jgi:hypothetical protein